MRALTILLFLFFAATTAHAGAWGEGSFENDDALDWVAQCARSNSVAPVNEAFRVALDAKYIEAPEGSSAVAAAEVVAAALGKPSAKLPTEIASWVRRQPVESLAPLAPLARQALARIQDSKASELRQLWSTGKPNNWRVVIADLEVRLGK